MVVNQPWPMTFPSYTAASLSSSTAAPSSSHHHPPSPLWVPPHLTTLYWDGTHNERAFLIDELQRKLASLRRCCAVETLNQLRLHVADLSRKLRDAFEKCHVDDSSVLAQSAAPEHDDLSDLVAECPLTWKSAIDSVDSTEGRTRRLAQYKELTVLRRNIATELAAQQAVETLRRRERRTRGDLNEARGLLELIQEVQRSIRQLEMKLNRRALDEDAIQSLQRVTVEEDLRLRRGVAVNDAHGLRKVRREVAHAAQQLVGPPPELAAFAAVQARCAEILATGAPFADMVACREAWLALERDVQRVDEMAEHTHSQRDGRRAVAEGTYRMLQDAHAARTIAAIIP